ncbi:MAG: efflux RND transporter periplasmic adaptor subunit [Thermoanaerobaculia bacterium]
MHPRRRASVLLIGSLTILSGCGAPTVVELPVRAEKPPIPVTVRTIAEGAALVSDVTYPAVITSDRDVVVVAKIAGTVTNVAFELGDRIDREFELASIDEEKDNSYRISAQSAFRGKMNGLRALNNAEGSTAAQVKQAEVAVAQAKAARELASTALRNSEATTEYTIRQAELAADQARTGHRNANAAATAATETVAVAVERARNGLNLAEQNRDQKLSATEQSLHDLQEMARTTLAATGALAVTLLDSTNLQTGLIIGSGIAPAYANELGNQDPATKTTAQAQMTAAWTAATAFRDRGLGGSTSDVQNGLAVLGQVKSALDATKLMLEATTPTTALPLVAAQGGTSLTSLRSSVGAAQAQASGSISQLTGILQGLYGVEATSSVMSDSLDIAVKDAELQLDAAVRTERQSEIGGNAQRDAAASGEAVATNAVQIARAGATAQLDAARIQVRLADLQMQNAAAAMALTQQGRESQLDGIRAQIDVAQGQLDLASFQLSLLSIRAPLSGTVTKRFVSAGDTVAPGSPVATLSDMRSLKATFSVDEEDLSGLKLGQRVTIRARSGHTLDASIVRIAPTADPQTRKFSVEATLGANAAGFAPGVVVDATLQLRRVPTRPSGTAFLPLQALTISQNETTVFTVKNGKVAKLPVTVVRIVGEVVEVAIDASPSTQVVLGGSSLLAEGASVTVNVPSAAAFPSSIPSLNRTSLPPRT